MRYGFLIVLFSSALPALRVEAACVSSRSTHWRPTLQCSSSRKGSRPAQQPFSGA
jgi:hypothetical protein